MKIKIGDKVKIKEGVKTYKKRSKKNKGQHIFGAFYFEGELEVKEIVNGFWLILSNGEFYYPEFLEKVI